MKTKTKEVKKGMSKILIIGVLLLISIFLIVFVSSQSNQSLQEELTGLEQNLTDSGYSWLINYSVNLLAIKFKYVDNYTIE